MWYWSSWAISHLSPDIPSSSLIWWYPSLDIPVSPSHPLYPPLKFHYTYSYVFLSMWNILINDMLPHFHYILCYRNTWYTTLLYEFESWRKRNSLRVKIINEWIDIPAGLMISPLNPLNTSADTNCNILYSYSEYYNDLLTLSATPFKFSIISSEMYVSISLHVYIYIIIYIYIYMIMELINTHTYTYMYMYTHVNTHTHTHTHTGTHIHLPVLFLSYFIKSFGNIRNSMQWAVTYTKIIWSNLLNNIR